MAAALAALNSSMPTPAVRLASAQKLQSNVTPAMAPLLARALERETDAQIKALLTLAHAQANLGNGDPGSASGRRQGAGRNLVAGDQERPAAAHRKSRRTRRQGALRGHRRGQVHRQPPGHDREPRPGLFRPVARQHPAARRARAGHHLRRHGHHQHGARRTADGRRLLRLRHADPVPRLVPGLHRLVPAGGDPGRLFLLPRWSAW